MPSRSSESSDFDAAFDEMRRTVVESVRMLDSTRPRVLIDGRSGSGKTTLASLLRDDWPGAGELQSIALDEFYPGWDGLAMASRIVTDDILRPHEAGEPGHYRRWDWDRDLAGESVAVAPERAVLIEGAGALTRESRPYADLSIWIDAPEESRKHRALRRDGDGYAPHWQRWAAQELQHIATHHPAAIADLVFELP